MKRRYSPGRMNRIEREAKKHYYALLLSAMDIINRMGKRESDLLDDIRSLTADCGSHALAVVQGGFFKRNDVGEVVSYRNERIEAELVFNRGAFPRVLVARKYAAGILAQELAKQIEKRMEEQK